MKRSKKFVIRIRTLQTAKSETVHFLVKFKMATKELILRLNRCNWSDCRAPTLTTNKN